MIRVTWESLDGCISSLRAREILPIRVLPSQGPLTKKGRVRSVWFNTETLLFTARARSWAFPEFIQGPRGCEDKGETQSYRLEASLCCLGGQVSLHRSAGSFQEGAQREPSTALLLLERRETRGPEAEDETGRPEEGRRPVGRKVNGGESR